MWKAGGGGGETAFNNHGFLSRVGKVGGGGGDTAFTTYGFLPDVDYSTSVSTTTNGSTSIPTNSHLPNWFGVGKDGVVRLGGDWSEGWLSQDTSGNLKYHAEFQKV